MDLLKNYLGLLVVICLWVCIWSIFDILSRKYLENKDKRMRVMVLASVFFSFLLIYFFPEQMAL